MLLEFAIEPSVIPSPIWSVPAVMVVVPVKAALLPVITRFEVELFWMIPVTFAPMRALTAVLAVPLPLFVTVPTMLMSAPEICTAPVARVPDPEKSERFPVPVNPPVI